MGNLRAPTEAFLHSFVLLLSSKNATNSTDGGAKFVFGQNMSERVLVSWLVASQRFTMNYILVIFFSILFYLFFFYISESPKRRGLKRRK